VNVARTHPAGGAFPDQGFLFPSLPLSTLFSPGAKRLLLERGPPTLTTLLHSHIPSQYTGT